MSYELQSDRFKTHAMSGNFFNEGITINMRVLFIVLMPEYGNKLGQGFYLDFQNKSCYIRNFQKSI